MVEEASLPRTQSGQRVGPLSGVRVLEFCWALAGPYAARFLALFGAEVIRLESHFRMDGARGAQPMPVGKFGINLSGYYNNANPSKLSMALNLNDERGRRLARRLVAVSDVVVDNFTPHTMDQFQLGYDDLVKLRPGIIVAKMPAFGLSGPCQEYRSFGQQVESFSGLAPLTGYPDERTLRASGQPWPDLTSGPIHAATAILAALHHCNVTGEGQLIEVAFCEAPACWLETAILDYTVNGRVQAGRGNRDPGAAPHGVYRCRGEDRWCAVAVGSEEQWRAFCRVLGQSAWTKRAEFADLAARKRHEDELDALVEAWTSEQTAEQVMSLLQEVGVPAGVVQSAEDLVAHDPHLRARGMYRRLAHPEAGEVLVDSPGFRLSSGAAEIRRAPLFGEQTEYVCKEILGITDHEIDRLLTEEVLA